MKLSDFQRDIVNRQRNIVFPDTVLNEGRFLRTLARRRVPLNPLQRAGASVLSLVYLLFTAFSFSAVFLAKWGPEDSDPVLVLPILAPLTLWIGITLGIRALGPNPPPRRDPYRRRIRPL